MTALAPELIHLTNREQEILRRMTGPETLPEMAAALCLSADTVRTYRNRLYVKLGACNRGQLVASAVRAGLLSVDVEKR